MNTYKVENKNKKELFETEFFEHEDYPGGTVYIETCWRRGAFKVVVQENRGEKVPVNGDPEGINLMEYDWWELDYMHDANYTNVNFINIPEEAQEVIREKWDEMGISYFDEYGWDQYKYNCWIEGEIDVEEI